MTCWHCKVREYIQYSEDPVGVRRCPACGELERDDPAKVKVQTEPRVAPVKRAASKPNGGKR